MVAPCDDVVLRMPAPEGEADEDVLDESTGERVEVRKVDEVEATGCSV